MLLDVFIALLSHVATPFHDVIYGTARGYLASDCFFLEIKLISTAMNKAPQMLQSGKRITQDDGGISIRTRADDGQRAPGKFL